MNSVKKQKGNRLGPVSIFFITLAASGWIVWIGNLFSISNLIGHTIPPVTNLTDLVLSSLFFLILGLTPSMIKSLFQSNK